MEFSEPHSLILCESSSHVLYHHSCQDAPMCCPCAPCAPDPKRLTCVNHIKGSVSEAGQKGAPARVCGGQTLAGQRVSSKGQRRWGSGPYPATSGHRAYWLQLDAKGHESGHVALFTWLLSPLYLQAGPQQKLPCC